MSNSTLVRRISVVAAWCSLLCVTSAPATEIHIAVASNFASTAETLAANFQAETGHRVIVSKASTGKLYAQILHGAPYDVFLAADTERPRRLEREGYVAANGRWPYACGRLVLWSARPKRVDPRGAVLATGEFTHLALANPKTAPYGAAAVQVMERLGYVERLRPRWVQGEDIGQTFQFVASGSAELGFIALSQFRSAAAGGSHWLVPVELHAPIQQEAVLLKRASHHSAAREFIAALKSDAARRIITQDGYAVPDASCAVRM